MKTIDPVFLTRSELVEMPKAMADSLRDTHADVRIVTYVDPVPERERYLYDARYRALLDTMFKLMATATPDMKPLTTKPSFEAVLIVARHYVRRPGNGAGGSLHGMFDAIEVDWRNAFSCRTHAEKTGDAEGRALANLLMMSSRRTRERVAHEVWRGKS